MSGAPDIGHVVAGKYRVERYLGKGGMGVVLEATHLRLGTRVALKLLRSDVADEPTLQLRFEREAVAISRLKTHHVVRVFDVDVTSEGQPFIVMELLEGHDLSRNIKAERPMATEDAVDVILQVCSAMDEAHAAGIVHRDLKPTNIFLADGTGLVKVLDFGISKLQGASELTTRESNLIGTPQYMAPERLAGRASDHRVDIWSIGVILYRLLAQRHPFVVDGNAPPFAFALAAISCAPIPLAEHRPDLPRELDAAIMTALENDPARRHASVAILARAIEPFGSGRVRFEPAPEPSSPSGSLDRGAAKEAAAETDSNLVPISAEPPVEPSTWLAPSTLSIRLDRPSPRGRLVAVVGAAGVLAGVVALSAWALSRPARNEPRRPVPIESATAAAIASPFPAEAHSLSAPPPATSTAAASAAPVAAQASTRADPRPRPALSSHPRPARATGRDAPLHL